MTPEQVILRLRRDRIGHPEPFLYQPIEHPELKHWPAQQPCAERWAMIVEHLGAPGTVIDIGCHTGWFCRQCARRGWSVFGFDRSREWLDIAKAMNILVPDNPPAYICGDLVAPERPHVSGPDVALCLSVAMYFFDDVAAGWRFFRKLSETVPRMFFDFGGQYADRLPFTSETVIAEMLAHTEYTDAQLLGHSDIQRPLYLFSR